MRCRDEPGAAALPTAAIVDDHGLTPAERLLAALEQARLWDVLAQRCAGRPPAALRIVIKPELAGFAADSPCITDPRLVELLIDALHEHGYGSATVVGTADSSALWAENRDLLALSDLLGYRFVTPGGRPYAISDLAEGSAQFDFPPHSALRGGTVSRLWCDADARIVFTKNRTDEAAGYALCLDTLIGVLPLTDKDLHYRARRHPGDVAAALLEAAPVDFCLIDAMISAHGNGGRRAPEPISTDTVIAAPHIILADYAGALKMGLDPAVSPMFAHAQHRFPLPRRYAVAGALDVYPGWKNVPAPLLQACQLRQAAGSLSRLVEPWLQCLDPELFPLKHPINARMNALIGGFFASTGTSPSREGLFVLANLLVGVAGRMVGAYRTLFAKDALHQSAAPLGIDTSTIEESAFAALVDDLRRLEPVAAAAPAASDELRWRFVDDAVVFEYTRVVPIDYGDFVRRVDVARTIEFMNDYLGGVVVPLARDDAGRPVRQAERNIYLPQPNYLVLYQGKPIDVSKLEVVEYDPDRNRLYWKTIASENGSAVHDDGIATFARAAEGTRISIMGRQQFVLPLFWQVFDPKMIPELHAALLSHAYQTFFDRTAANFEALVEGREIRIGRPVDEAAIPPIEALMPWFQKIAEACVPLLQAGRDEPAGSRLVDEDGFVHIVPAAAAGRSSTSNPLSDASMAEIRTFIDGLGRAMLRDLIWRTEAA